MSIWQRLGKGSALLSLGVLLPLHVDSHGSMDLNPVHHWLSEYVLSPSVFSQALMRAAFVLLGLTAWAAGMAIRRSGQGREGAAFVAGGALLSLMVFFDTDPNDGRIYPMLWPPSPGNLHQVLLYGAMPLVLLGMGGWAWPRRKSDPLGYFLVAAAALAAIVQMFLSLRHPTLYGGITERLIVGCTLAWVLRLLSRTEASTTPSLQPSSRRE